jgi:hypothetical protein
MLPPRRDMPCCAVLCSVSSLQVMELVEGNRVLEHILMRNKVLDGDNYVLHVQVCVYRT